MVRVFFKFWLIFSIQNILVYSQFIQTISSEQQKYFTLHRRHYSCISDLLILRLCILKVSYMLSLSASVISVEIWQRFLCRKFSEFSLGRETKQKERDFSKLFLSTIANRMAQEGLISTVKQWALGELKYCVNDFWNRFIKAFFNSTAC